MYYSTELLSKRRRGKLAHCWYAATTSEKMFKRSFKSADIIRIDVSITCQEILKTFEVQKSTMRFSLYLSSQLMFGVTRILFYQTTLFQNYLFSVKRGLEEYVEEKGYGFAVDERVLTLRGPSSIEQLSDIYELPRDLHLMRDEPAAAAFQYTIQDAECLNFGMLTIDERDFTLEPSSTLQLEEMERIHLNETTKTFEDSSTIPLADIESYEAHLEQEKEIHSKSLKTPRKRSSQIKVDTPTKRSRLRMDGSSLPEAQPELPSEIQLEAQPELPSEIQPEAQPELPSESRAQIQPEAEPLADAELGLMIAEEQGEFVIRRRKRKTYDVTMQLSGKTIQSWLRDVAIHTKKLSIVNLNMKSAGKFLTVPSTTVRGFRETSWSSNLTRHFNLCFTGPFVEETYFTEIDEVEGEEVPSAEAVRPETLNRTALAELSSQIPILEQSEQQSKVAEKTLVEEVHLPPRIDETHEGQESTIAVQLPEITGIDQEIDEAIMKSPQAQGASEDSFLFAVHENLTKSVRRDTRLKTPSSFSSSSHAGLTTVDIVAMLDVHFKNSECITFEELISPDCYDREDAACCLLELLACHTKMMLVMRQAAAFDTIWIQKYPKYD